MVGGGVQYSFALSVMAASLTLRENIVRYNLTHCLMEAWVLTKPWFF